MALKKNRILNKEEVQQKINRMAYEILEDNYEEKELLLIGIKERGFLLAKQLQKQLQSFADINIVLGSIKLNKADPVDGNVYLDIQEKDIKGKVVVLVDDVANTGRTLTYAIKSFLGVIPKKIQTVVLVDRKHKIFPIHADYVGLSLATTIHEHIMVDLSTPKKEGVFLS